MNKIIIENAKFSKGFNVIFGDQVENFTNYNKAINYINECLLCDYGETVIEDRVKSDK